MQILTLVYDAVAVIVLFGAAIFVHEFGHFWMARRLGMKVEGFAIGFGPKIFGWTKDGIEYSVRWIPAGGFVKLPQMITSEALEGGNDAAEKVPPAPPFHKILVAIAGPLMNVIFGFVIAVVIYFVGLPVAVNPSIIGVVKEGSDEYNKGIRDGDQIVSVDGKMARSWQDVHEIVALAPKNVLTVVTERDGAKFTNELTAKVNETLQGLKVLNLEPRDHPVIMVVDKGSPAEKAGLHEKDKIVSFGGVAISGQEQLIGLVSKRGGEATEIVVERDNKPVPLTVTPRIIDQEKKTGRIGVALDSDSTTVYRVMKPGPLPWDTVSEVWNKMIGVFNALLHYKQTGVGPKQLSGPVGIMAMLAIWVNTDIRLALYFLVMLNINLAILNMLPVPVLDGGHVLMSIIEKIRRRPISMKMQEYATTVFAVLLISFMLYVTFFDIGRLPLFKLMFNRDVKVEPTQEVVEPPVSPSK